MSAELSAHRESGALTGSGLSFLPSPLLEPTRPLLAIATGWATAFFPSILLAGLVSLLLPAAGQPSFEVDGLATVSLLVVFAPLVETLIMGGVLVVLMRFVSPTVAVLISSIGWGVAHSTVAAAWGLVIWWPFLIFSTLFVTWRQRSFWAAIGLVTLVHGLHNLPSALMLLYGLG